jgi:hypothetical protein
VDFWILPTFFVTCKIHGCELLFYNVLILRVWNFGTFGGLCLRNLKSIEWIECDFNLLFYRIPKILIILKSFLSI